MPIQRSRTRVVLVTGPSGAGRSTAINVLEDLGFEAIDNIPLRMIPRLFDGDPLDHPLALGIDVRNRDFSLSRMLDLHLDLLRQTDGDASLLFLDCRPDVLLRRYSETRRRHPMAQEETPDVGITREIELLRPIQARADIVIDTSLLSPHDLKSEMHQWFADDASQKLAVALQSFSYKRGIPHGVDMVFDCRFLSNPHWDAALREKTGLDPEVQAYVQNDTRLAPFTRQITDMLTFLLPEIEVEGKTHLSIGIGCTGGQHRSVVLTELVATALAEDGWRVSIGHKELARRGIVPSGNMAAPDRGRAAE
ncbi:MAG: RNase adapter RapZ [Marivita sp.]|uniref:RNase adapter RapZ n=1 Tax=Marivita sp. TaxID=2003365 RepID=UPI003EF531D7